MARPEYRYRHQQARARLLAHGPSCYHCGKPGATIADHDPPLVSVPPGGVWRGVLRASCQECSNRQAAALRGARSRMRRGEPLPSRPW